MLSIPSQPGQEMFLNFTNVRKSSPLLDKEEPAIVQASPLSPCELPPSSQRPPCEIPPSPRASSLPGSPSTCFLTKTEPNISTHCLKSFSTLEDTHQQGQGKQDAAPAHPSSGPRASRATEARHPPPPPLRVLDQGRLCVRPLASSGTP